MNKEYTFLYFILPANRSSANHVLRRFADFGNSLGERIFSGYLPKALIGTKPTCAKHYHYPYALMNATTIKANPPSSYVNEQGVVPFSENLSPPFAKNEVYALCPRQG